VILANRGELLVELLVELFVELLGDEVPKRVKITYRQYGR